MGAKEISLADRGLFEEFLARERHELAAYSFQNIYLWKALYEVSWQVIGGCLCVFFRDRTGCFLYLPPLGNRERETVRAAFEAMAGYNDNPAVSRIENVEERDVADFVRMGYTFVFKGHEYICSSGEMAALAGDKYKSKRAAANHFAAHYAFTYEPYSPRDEQGCLELYGRWMAEASERNTDGVYRGMLADSRACLELLLKEYAELGMPGRVLRVDGSVKAFTFGYPLGDSWFCIFFETADRAARGAAQFIFRKFCADAGQYAFINMMDDSGLENLRHVKLSYHPCRFVPSYIISARQQ